jgi:pimeloyl-ACP methyl ester carboxylesterase
VPVEPCIRHVVAGGLDHRVLEWDGGGSTTVLLVHGFADAGGTWARLVRHLPDHLHCVAPDLRGHGGTERVGRGGYYFFPDYVRDLRDLVDALKRERLVLVGHSLGGGIAALFTGTWPEEVEQLVLVEGLGPPEEAQDEGPRRLRRWIREVQQVHRGERTTGPLKDLDAAAAKLRRHARGLDREASLELARWLTHTDPDGALAWRHDPLHRTRTPLLFQVARWEPFLRAITCPVLTVCGERSWYKLPDLPGRRALMADQRHVQVAGAGHSVHQDAPEELADVIGRFLAELEPGDDRCAKP